jgi:hypothetical protein
MRRRTVAITLVALVAIVSLMGYLSLTGDTQGFPRRLGSMSMAEFKTGTEALSELDIMHLRSPEVKMVDAFIVKYEGKEDDTAIVYVSIEEDDEQAQDLLDLMNEKIDPSDGYTYVKEMSLLGEGLPTVYYTEGHGAHHYLWAQGDRLYWIALSGLSLTDRLDFLEESLGVLP